MSALDTVSGSFEPSDTFVLNGTRGVDLPDSYTYDSYDYQGTTPQPQMADTPRSPTGISFTGALNALSATAQAGLNIYTTAQNINTSARDAQSRAELARLTIETGRETNRANAAIATARTDAVRQVAVLDAQTAVRNATAAAEGSVNGTRGGAYVASALSTNWPVLVGVGGLLYLALQSKGAKA